MKKLILSFLFGGMIMLSNAQVVISSVASPYTQNFDALSNDTTFTTTHSMAITGWAIFERGTGTAVDQMYKVDRGTHNNGETYSYGDSAATDRALGSLASASNLPSFGVGFLNSTGASITTFNVSYKGEQWRSGDTSASSLDSLIFEYSTTATGVNDTLAIWNPVYSLMLNTINLTTTTVGALDGNTNSNTVSGSFTALVANGSKIFFRWRDINKIQSDDGLAIDDLSVTLATGGTPKPILVSTNPADNATLVSPSLTSLTMTFDQNVTAGTGNIKINNLTDVSTQTIACTAATISGAVVTIPGVTLLAGKQYSVQFDSTAFTAGSVNSYGIYDNTSWNFETMPNAIFDYTQNNLDFNYVSDGQFLLNMDQDTDLQATIYAANGQILSTEKIHCQQGVNHVVPKNIPTAQGIYLIRLQGDGRMGVLTFVK